jgi:hypothetical protein
MLSDISIGGVYVPQLLVLVFVALALMAIFSRLLIALDFNRLVIYPPIVNISLFSIWLSLLVWFMSGELK